MSDLKAGDRVRLKDDFYGTPAGALATVVVNPPGRDRKWTSIKWDRSSHPGQNHILSDGGWDAHQFQKIDGPFVVGDMVKVIDEEDHHYGNFGMVVRHDGDTVCPWWVSIDGADCCFDAEELEYAVKPEETKVTKLEVGAYVDVIAEADEDYGRRGTIVEDDGSLCSRPLRVVYSDAPIDDAYAGWFYAKELKLVEYTKVATATPDPEFIVVDDQDEIMGVHDTYAEALSDAREAADHLKETFCIYKKVAIAAGTSEVTVTEF